MTVTGLPLPAGAAPTLVGREREQAILREALAVALAGQGSVVLIGGEAGIGKTALAETLLAEAAGQGAQALVGRCYGLAETPPYGLWIDLFTRYHLPSPPLPRAFARRGTVGAVASQGELCQHVRDFLAALASERPLVLLLDDLHWADLASLDLLRAIARDLAGLSLCILVTYRSDELTRHQPLYAHLPSLVREGGATRLDLRHLTESAVQALIAGRYALSNTDAQHLGAYLLVRAEGNPLFTLELLRALEENGALTRTAIGWTLGVLDQVPVPSLLAQVIGGRVARLNEEVARLLTIAAIIGQEVPLALWAKVAETDEEAVLVALEAAVAAGLLAEDPTGDRARFAHALVRETIYQRELAARRRRWHRRVGDVLATTRDADPDATAYHFQQADDDRALTWLLAAADRAEEALAFATARERLDGALRLLERAGAPAGDRGWLLYRLGYVQVGWTAAPNPAVAVEAAQLAAEAGDPHLAAAAQNLRGLAHCFAGAVRRGLADLARAAETAGVPAADGPARRLLNRRQWADLTTGTWQSGLIVWLANAGRYAEVPPLAAQVIACAPDGPVVHLPLAAVSPYAHHAKARAQAAWGDPKAAQQSFTQAGEGYGLRRIWPQVGAVLLDELHLAWLPYDADQPGAGEVLVAAVRRLTLAPEIAPVFHAAARAPYLLLAGRWDEAQAATAVARMFRDTNPAGSLGTTVLGRLAAARGAAGLLATLLREVLPDGPLTEPGDCNFRSAVELQRAAASLALDDGNLPAARAWLEAHDRWLAWSGSVLGRAEGHLGWAAYHRAAGDRTLARRHADQALAHAGAPRQPLAQLAAHRLFAELAIDAGGHAEAVPHLDVALALSEACAAPYERALTLLALARLRGATGDRAGGLALLDEARDTLSSLGAAPALARVLALRAQLGSRSGPAPGLPGGLTAREAEVLALVATGLTNAQVAAQLFLSTHTVNSHLTTIYGKLQVPSRAAAIRFALDHNLH